MSTEFADTITVEEVTAAFVTMMETYTDPVVDAPAEGGEGEAEDDVVVDPAEGEAETEATAESTAEDTTEDTTEGE